MRFKEGYIYVLGLCLVLRLAVMLAIAPWHPESESVLIGSSDPYLYHHLAISLLRGEGYILPNMLQASPGSFAYPGEHETIWPPGYSAFLAMLYALFGVCLTPVLLVQGILSTLGCWFLMRAAESVGGRRAGLWAGGLYAVEPVSILYANLVLSEGVHIPLVCLCVFILSQAITAADARQRLIVLMGLGVALGAATWVRVATIPIAGALMLMLGIVYWRNNTGVRQVAMLTLVSAGVYLLTVAPWQWRNYRLFGVWAFSTSADFSMLAGLDYFQEQRGTLYRKAYEAARAAGEDLSRLSPFQRARYWRQTALNEWRNAPWYYFRRSLERMVIVVFNPGTTNWGHVLRVETPSGKIAGRSLWQAGREYLARLNGVLLAIGAYTFAYLALYYSLLILCVFCWRTVFANPVSSRFAMVAAFVAFISLSTNIINTDSRMRLPMMVFLTPALAVGLTNLLEHRRRKSGKNSPNATVEDKY